MVWGFIKPGMGFYRVVSSRLWGKWSTADGIQCLLVGCLTSTILKGGMGMRATLKRKGLSLSESVLGGPEDKLPPRPQLGYHHMLF
jgi:hypothetical protein